MINVQNSVWGTISYPVLNEKENEIGILMERQVIKYSKEHVKALILTSKDDSFLRSVPNWYFFSLKTDEIFFAIYQDLMNPQIRLARKLELLKLCQLFIKDSRISSAELQLPKINRIMQTLHTCIVSNPNNKRTLTDDEGETAIDTLQSKVVDITATYTRRVTLKEESENSDFMGPYLSAPLFAQNKTGYSLLDKLDTLLSSNSLKSTHLVQNFSMDIWRVQKFLFSQLTPPDFLAKNIEGVNKGTMRGAQWQIAEFTNRLSSFVAQRILNQQDLNKRLEEMAFFHRVRDCLWQARDFHSAYIIHAGLTCPAISRLKGTWAAFNKNFANLASKTHSFEDLVKPNSNFKKIRETFDKLEQQKVGFIPFLMPYYRDFIMCQNSEIVDQSGELNSKASEVFSQTVDKILRNVSLFQPASPSVELPLMSNLIEILRQYPVDRETEKKLLEISYKTESKKV